MDFIEKLVQQRVHLRISTSDDRRLPLSYEAFTARVVEIVRYNYETERVYKVMIKSSSYDKLNDEVLNLYADRVIDCFLKEHRRVESLRTYSGAEWYLFQKQLSERAARALGHYAPSAPPPTPEDVAQEICAIILKTRFPYDVEFDAWVGRILINEIKEIARSRDFGDRFPQRVYSFDQQLVDALNALTFSEVLEDEQQQSVFSQMDLRDALERAIDALGSKAAQAIIRLGYLDGLSDSQIAAMLNMSKGSLATARHRALKKLAHLLPKELRRKRDIDPESGAADETNREA